MDEAVEAASENFQVRLIRAINSLHCPGFLGRSKVASVDFEWLLETIENKYESEVLDAQSVKIALYYAGKFALKEKDSNAINLLERATSMPVETDVDAELAKTLKKARLKSKGVGKSPNRRSSRI